MRLANSVQGMCWGCSTGDRACGTSCVEGSCNSDLEREVRLSEEQVCEGEVCEEREYEERECEEMACEVEIETGTEAVAYGLVRQE